MYFVGACVITYVLVTNVRLFGELKSQETNLVNTNSYQFNISEQMGMVGISYFYVNELLQRVKEYQDENPNEDHVALGPDINKFDQ